MKRPLSLVALAVVCMVRLPGAADSVAKGDGFGSGVHTFDIPFVTIGEPGNLGDVFSGVGSAVPLGAGSVSYAYRLGKYEVSERMIDAANALGGLEISKDTRGPDKPATSVTWLEAARFVNWLNTSTGNQPAYKISSRVIPGKPLPGRGGGTGPDVTVYDFHLWFPTDPGYNTQNLFRNSLAKYFLPSIDEWFKGAYYDPVSGVYYDFPTGSNRPPIAVAEGTDAGTAVYSSGGFLDGPADITLAGGASPFGTIAQGGNVAEWMETEFDRFNDNPQGKRSLRGGTFGGSTPALASDSLGAAEFSVPQSRSESNSLGFRVASLVPEPSTLSITALLCGGISLGRGRRTSRHMSRIRAFN